MTACSNTHTEKNGTNSHWRDRFNLVGIRCLNRMMFYNSPYTMSHTNH